MKWEHDPGRAHGFLRWPERRVAWRVEAREFAGSCRTSAASLLFALLAACSSSPPPSTEGNELSPGKGGQQASGDVSGAASGGSTASPPLTGDGAKTNEGSLGDAPIDQSGAGGAGTNGMNPANPAGSGGEQSPPAPVNELFVGEDGLDTNPGTEQAPLASLNRAQLFAKAGFTIWVLPGTLRYSVTQTLATNGSAKEPIRLYAAPGSRPVLDFSAQPRNDGAQRGIDLRGDFWHVRGLEVQNAGDNGALIGGANNVIEDVIFHHNGDTGLQIMANTSQATDNSRAANNLVLNCDSFENFDAATQGENADGFAAKLRIGPGNVFRGCRAWNNADDGWDFFAADDVATIEDSWAFLNGFIAGGGNSAGDGNGFKLGGRPNGVGQGDAPHVVRGSVAFDNRTCGFTLNNNQDTPVLSGCGTSGNANDYCNLECNGAFESNISGAQAITRPRNPDGSLPSLR